jgi:hypothetical protein
VLHILESLARPPNQHDASTFYCEQTTYQGTERVSKEKCPGIDPSRFPAAKQETQASNPRGEREKEK